MKSLARILYVITLLVTMGSWSLTATGGNEALVQKQEGLADACGNNSNLKHCLSGVGPSNWLLKLVVAYIIIAGLYQFFFWDGNSNSKPNRTDQSKSKSSVAIFHCPKCGQKYRLLEERSGPVSCKECDHQFTVRHPAHKTV